MGISRDQRSFYDIMRRINSIFALDIDLSELHRLGQAESQELVDTLEKSEARTPLPRELIERAHTDFNYVPFQPTVELDPALDNFLEDILRNPPEMDDEN